MTIENTILDQITQSAQAQSPWRAVESLANGSSGRAGVHLAVLVEPYLGYILEGRKTVESRFSKNAIAPYRSVAQGDLVLLKVAAGPVVGCFTVAWSQCVELDESRLDGLRSEFSAAICADNEFWASRSDKRYATLIGICDVRCLPALKVSKSDRRGWIVLRSAGRRLEEQLSLL